MSKRGFTLIELIIVITVISFLGVIAAGNFTASLERSQDGKRKFELASIQSALEEYYEDKGGYPQFDIFGASQLCESLLCKVEEKVYMTEVPTDTNGNVYVYDTATDGTYYKLYSCIENQNDTGYGVAQIGYTPSCGACGACKYEVVSPNIALDIPGASPTPGPTAHPTIDPSITPGPTPILTPPSSIPIPTATPTIGPSDLPLPGPTDT